MIKKLTIALLLFSIWLASAWTLFKPGFFRIHDFVHGARIGEMSLALADGHFPVRWSRNFGFGYGMPLFEFYAPLPYYVGSGLFLAGLDLVLILKILFAGVSLLTVIGAYLLGKELLGRMSGIMVAALLNLAPYRAVNLYVRGALGEVWGLMALPWILYGILLVIRQRRWGWLVLTISLSVLMLSHNLTTLMFVPLSGVFAACYGLIEWFTQRRKLRQLIAAGWQLAGSYVLAIGLSAFYLFPALMEKGYTKVESIVGGYFDYHLHFLYIRQFILPGWSYGGSSWGPDDGISFFLGWGQWLALGCLASAGLVWVFSAFRHRQSAQNRFSTRLLAQVSLSLGLAAVAIWMTIGKSTSLWDGVPFLAYIQFPWRWLSIAVVFLSLASGYSLWFLPQRWQRLCLMLGVVLVTVVGNFWKFQPESYLDTASSFYYTDPERIHVHMSGVLQDYIPIQMSDDLIFNAQAQVPLLINQTQAVGIEVDRVHEKLLRTNFTQPQRLELAMADFPGWSAELDGQNLPIGHTPLGVISLDIPAGEHLVSVRFGPTKVRLLSDILSAVSALVLLFLVLPGVKAREKIHQDD